MKKRNLQYDFSCYDSTGPIRKTKVGFEASAISPVKEILLTLGVKGCYFKKCSLERD